MSNVTGLKSGKLLKLALMGMLGLVLITSVVVAICWTRIKTQYYLSEFKSAPPVERKAIGEKLLAIGPPTVPGLLGCLDRDDAELCNASSELLGRMAKDWGPTHEHTNALAASVFAMYASASEPGQLAILKMMPALRQTTGPEHDKQREKLVKSALSHPSQQHRIEGIRLALWPEVGLLREVVPLLEDKEAQVRRAAMLAIGPDRPEASASERNLVPTDELLYWLHDEDEEVRRLCAMALQSRGLTEQEIHRGRLLTHKKPGQRMELIVDLVHDDQVNLGAWLDRLSRDPHPSVRASAARAIAEKNVGLADRLEQMRQADPDPTVRRIVEFYRSDFRQRR